MSRSRCLTYWPPCQVTGCVPGELFEFAVGPDVLTLDNRGYRLAPEGAGTTETEYFRIEPSLPMPVYRTLPGPLRGRTNRDGMRTTLRRMKAVVEA